MSTLNLVLQKKRWKFKIRGPGFTHGQYSLPCIAEVQEEEVGKIEKASKQESERAKERALG